MSEPTVENILRAARQHLVAVGAELALVMLLDDQGELTVRKAHGLTAAEEIPQRTRFFDKAMSGESLLVMDATKDHRFREVPDQIRSVICVPVLSGETVVGLLYGENSQAGRFSHKAHDDTAKYGKSLGERLPGVLQVEKTSPSDSRPAQGGPGYLLLTAGLLVLALVWPVVGSRVAPEETPTRPIAKKSAALPPDPTITARSFLILVQNDRFEQAYQLLTPDLRASLPVEAFSQRARSWLQDERNQHDIAYRNAALSRRKPESAILRIESRTDGRDWTWDLVLLENEWYIEKLRGGPLG